MAGVDYEECISIDVDPSGNIYATGDFRGTVDFDPSPGTLNLTSLGTEDIFIAKLDILGNLVWAKRMGGSGYDEGRSIVVDNSDASGNVYLTGYFQGTVDFDPGPGTLNLTSPESVTNSFISKFDGSGNLVWAKAMDVTNGNFESVNAWSITIDRLGNVYTTGTFMGTVDFDPSSGISNLISTANYSNNFILKLDRFGDFVWAKGIISTNHEHSSSIAVDDFGYVYTTGYFRGVADFDPDVGVFNITAQTYQDIFVSKLDSSGSFVWAKAMQGSSLGGKEGFSIAVDDFGNIYTTGYFTGTVDFNPSVGIFNLTSMGGTWDNFICKLDNLGNFVWAKAIGGTGPELSKSIALDESSNIYFTGEFTDEVDFDPGLGIFNLTTNATDIFVCNLDSSGSFIWAKQVSTIGTGGSIGASITLHPSGSIYVGGYFQSETIIFGTTTLTNVSNNNYSDIFIAKLDIIITGIENTENTKVVSIYPNPATLEISIIGYNPAYLILCNTLGQTVAEVNNSNKLYVGNLPQGLYVLQLFDENDNLVKTEKIILSK